MGVPDIVAIAAAYLLGAVPFGLLAGKLRGVDIRQHGSGNIGATNVVRVLGKPLGFTTFILDALKGLLPAAFFYAWISTWMTPALDRVTLSVLCGAAAILGHNFPVFLGFKGGKGVATSAGVLIGVAPLSALSGVVTWALLFFTLRYVSLASIIAAAAVAVSGWIFYMDTGYVLPSVLTVLSLLIIVRHRANIARLLSGTESRFTKKRDS